MLMQVDLAEGETWAKASDFNEEEAYKIVWKMVTFESFFKKIQARPAFLQQDSQMVES